MDHYQQRKSKTRQRILDAAWDLFRQYGVTDSKVTDICELAGVAKKTFFNHFDSKDELVQELGKHSANQLQQTLSELCDATASTQQRIEGIFQAIAERMRVSGDIHPEFMLSLLYSDKYTGSHSGNKKGVYVFKEMFVAIAKEGIKRGDIPRRVDAQAVGNAIFGFWFALNFTRVYEGRTAALKQLQAAPAFIAAAIAGEQ